MLVYLTSASNKSWRKKEKRESICSVEGLRETSFEMREMTAAKLERDRVKRSSAVAVNKTDVLV